MFVHDMAFTFMILVLLLWRVTPLPLTLAAMISLRVTAEKGQIHVLSKDFSKLLWLLILLHVYNYRLRVMSTCENKVLAISKNSLGCAVYFYFYSFPLVQHLQFCFKTGTKQETRVAHAQVVPSLSMHSLSTANKAGCWW